MLRNLLNNFWPLKAFVNYVFQKCFGDFISSDIDFRKLDLNLQQGAYFGLKNLELKAFNINQKLIKSEKIKLIEGWIGTIAMMYNRTKGKFYIKIDDIYLGFMVNQSKNCQNQYADESSIIKDSSTLTAEEVSEPIKFSVNTTKEKSLIFNLLNSFLSNVEIEVGNIILNLKHFEIDIYTLNNPSWVVCISHIIYSNSLEVETPNEDMNIDIIKEVNEEDEVYEEITINDETVNNLEAEQSQLKKFYDGSKVTVGLFFVKLNMFSFFDPKLEFDKLKRGTLSECLKFENVCDHATVLNLGFDSSESFELFIVEDDKSDPTKTFLNLDLKVGEIEAIFTPLQFKYLDLFAESLKYRNLEKEENEYKAQSKIKRCDLLQGGDQPQQANDKKQKIVQFSLNNDMLSVIILKKECSVDIPKLFTQFAEVYGRDLITSNTQFANHFSYFEDDFLCLIVKDFNLLHGEIHIGLCDFFYSQYQKKCKRLNVTKLIFKECTNTLKMQPGHSILNHSLRSISSKANASCLKLKKSFSNNESMYHSIMDANQISGIESSKQGSSDEIFMSALETDAIIVEKYRNLIGENEFFSKLHSVFSTSGLVLINNEMKVKEVHLDLSPLLIFEILPFIFNSEVYKYLLDSIEIDVNPKHCNAQEVIKMKKCIEVHSLNEEAQTTSSKFILKIGEIVVQLKTVDQTLLNDFFEEYYSKEILRKVCLSNSINSILSFNKNEKIILKIKEFTFEKEADLQVNFRDFQIYYHDSALYNSYLLNPQHLIMSLKPSSSGSCVEFLASKNLLQIAFEELNVHYNSDYNALKNFNSPKQIKFADHPKESIQPTPFLAFIEALKPISSILALLEVTITNLKTNENLLRHIYLSHFNIDQFAPTVSLNLDSDAQDFQIKLAVNKLGIEVGIFDEKFSKSELVKWIKVSGLNFSSDFDFRSGVGLQEINLNLSSIEINMNQDLRNTSFFNRDTAPEQANILLLKSFNQYQSNLNQSTYDDVLQYCNFDKGNAQQKRHFLSLKVRLNTKKQESSGIYATPFVYGEPNGLHRFLKNYHRLDQLPQKIKEWVKLNTEILPHLYIDLEVQIHNVCTFLSGNEIDYSAVNQILKNCFTYPSKSVEVEESKQFEVITKVNAGLDTYLSLSCKECYFLITEQAYEMVLSIEKIEVKLRMQSKENEGKSTLFSFEVLGLLISFLSNEKLLKRTTIMNKYMTGNSKPQNKSSLESSTKLPKDHDQKFRSKLLPSFFIYLLEDFKMETSLLKKVGFIELCYLNKLMLRIKTELELSEYNSLLYSKNKKDLSKIDYIKSQLFDISVSYLELNFCQDSLAELLNFAMSLQLKLNSLKSSVTQDEKQSVVKQQKKKSKPEKHKTEVEFPEAKTAKANQIVDYDIIDFSKANGGIKQSVLDGIDINPKRTEGYQYKLNIHMLKIFFYAGMDFDFCTDFNSLLLEDYYCHRFFNTNSSMDLESTAPIKYESEDNFENSFTIQEDYFETVKSMKVGLEKKQIPITIGKVYKELPKTLRNSTRDYTNYVIILIDSLALSLSHNDNIKTFLVSRLEINSFEIQDNILNSKFKKLFSKFESKSNPRSKLLSIKSELIKSTNDDIETWISITLSDLNILISQSTLDFVLNYYSYLSEQIESSKIEKENENEKSNSFNIKELKKSKEDPLSLGNSLSKKGNLKKDQKAVDESIGFSHETINFNHNIYEEKGNENSQFDFNKQDQPVFSRKLCINKFSLNFSYFSQSFKISDLTEKYIQILNLANISDLRVIFNSFDFNHKLKLVDALQYLLSFYVNDIKNNQISSLVSSLSILKPLTKLADGVIDLFRQPYIHYKMEKSMKDGVTLGVKNFLIGLTTQSVFIGEKTVAVFQKMLGISSDSYLNKKSFYKQILYMVDEEKRKYDETYLK